MSEGLKGKSHDGTNSLTFGPLQQLEFDNVATVSANTAITTIQARLPVAQDCQIVKVCANVSAISGSPAIQITYGTGTPGAPAAQPSAPDQPSPRAAVTVSVFNTPACLTTAANPTGIPPAVPSTVYPQSAPGLSAVTGAGAGLLTLRVKTGPGDTASNLKVGLVIRNLDPFPNIPATVPYTDW